MLNKFFCASIIFGIFVNGSSRVAILKKFDDKKSSNFEGRVGELSQDGQKIAVEVVEVEKEREERHRRIIEVLKLAKVRQVCVIVGHVAVLSVVPIYGYLGRRR
jgi:hypothetical protein